MKKELTIGARRRLFLTFILMLSVYAADILYIWRKGLYLLNSDAVSEMILAKRLDRDGDLILSNGWYYSSELRVVNTQLVYRIGFAVFPNNWMAAKTLSVAIFLLFFILCAFLLAYAIRRIELAPFLATVLIAPYSDWYGWNVILNSYYIPHIGFTIISISLFILCVSPEWRMRISAPVRRVLAILLLVVAFTACLGGLRQMMICYIPLWCAAVEYFLLHHREDHSLKDKLRIPVLASVYAIIGLAGYEINNTILHQHYHFATQSETIWSAFDLNRVITCMGDLISLFGWNDSDVHIMSPGGVANLCSLIIVLLGIIGFVLTLTKKKLSAEEELLEIFSVTAFAILLVVYSFTDTYNESYWTVFLPLAFTGILILFVHLRDELYRIILPVTLAVMVLLCSLNTMRHPYISWVPNDTAQIALGDWLKTSGYTQGYATFWDSNILTALTDGQVEMWTINDVNDLMSIYPWLQSVDHSVQMPEGKFFIVRAAKDAEDEDLTMQNIIHYTMENLIYQDESYLVYGFDSVQDYQEKMAQILSWTK
ncbi:hypothetical protein SAMN02745687_01125 [Lachnospiraceae bacterium NK3A20]|nr:hypothetical protein SAMN02745687_01125 [Lachnospiraceae bacterium NK3A20]